MMDAIVHVPVMDANLTSMDSYFELHYNSNSIGLYKHTHVAYPMKHEACLIVALCTNSVILTSLHTSHWTLGNRKE